ncbi:MAG: hypothetical protein IPK76_22840 [Lewinellaceae bacterium]|nr:hypothetical protein [Lewinellaceae bacterium]
MKKYLVSLFLLLTAATLCAQVSVNQDNSTPDPSAMLDVKSSDKGMLIPRMTTAQRDGIATPAPGLIIYNTTDSCFNYYTGTNWYKDCGQKRDVLEGPLMPELLKAGKGNSVVNVKGIVADELGNAYVLGYFRDTLYWGQMFWFPKTIPMIFL